MGPTGPTGPSGGETSSIQSCRWVLYVNTADANTAVPVASIENPTSVLNVPAYLNTAPTTLGDPGFAFEVVDPNPPPGIFGPATSYDWVIDSGIPALAELSYYQFVQSGPPASAVASDVFYRINTGCSLVGDTLTRSGTEGTDLYTFTYTSATGGTYSFTRGLMVYVDLGGDPEPGIAGTFLPAGVFVYNPSAGGPPKTHRFTMPLVYSQAPDTTLPTGYYHTTQMYIPAGGSVTFVTGVSPMYNYVQDEDPSMVPFTLQGMTFDVTKLN